MEEIRAGGAESACNEQAAKGGRPSETPRADHRPAGAPAANGYRMPADWEPHQSCLLCWPTRSRAFWGEYYLLAQATYAAVARAIAAFEPVLVVASPALSGSVTSA